VPRLNTAQITSSQRTMTVLSMLLHTQLRLKITAIRCRQKVALLPFVDF
jgi:hypothetical protein